MGNQNSLYRLKGINELDDAFVGGKRGRGAAGKIAILVACEHNDGKPGFVAMKAVEDVNHVCVRTFAEQTISPGQTLHTDAFVALKVLTEVRIYKTDRIHIRPHYNHSGVSTCHI